MAVISFDLEDNSVCILVEKDDIVRTKDNNTVTTKHGRDYWTSKVFVNGEIKTCIVRGERSK